jgi:hypothetical protein
MEIRNQKFRVQVYDFDMHRVKNILRYCELKGEILTLGNILCSVNSEIYFKVRKVLFVKTT